MSSLPPGDFFSRNRLPSNALSMCEDVIYNLYGPCRVTPLPHQGYCSFSVIVTLPLISISRIVQFRPTIYPVDVAIHAEAKSVYSNLAPAASALGSVKLENVSLFVYEFEFIRGVPYQSIRPDKTQLSEQQFQRLVRLVESFAQFVARGWMQQSATHQSRRCSGKVGTCIKSKVEELSRKLPRAALRCRAREVYLQLDLISALPVVLCHGDLLPTNLMVDEVSGRLCGVVDWAEAEMLPFGMCLYGLEHLLGYVSSSNGFHYYLEAQELRQFFWTRIIEEIPPLSEDTLLRAAVGLSRDVGVLLWYGYAWDDGAINRVVDDKNDLIELTLLETFLGTEKVVSPKL
ncbi:hypothetical protein K402DRAFT_405324 [Aulographum hederae CBS 113979]|uniref:Aminoglycoside phosphotransferase domain-containing protein n=1 Tax=Aulographum hederae CBS 113979 TaxID=1176131 RepID=A0A6G1GWJ0_9PEZI|nr:hypothetical protein K402DRAFT_405324 [Aulographum hederae CBS 113979]